MKKKTGDVEKMRARGKIKYAKKTSGCGENGHAKNLFYFMKF